MRGVRGTPHQGKKDSQPGQGMSKKGEKSEVISQDEKNYNKNFIKNLAFS